MNWLKWIALSLLFVRSAYAVELLELIPQIKVEPSVSVTEVDNDKFSLLSMILGCDLDAVCMRKMLTEVLHNDPKPAYQAYFNLLQHHQAEIDYEAQYCNIPERKLVRKDIADCLAIELKKRNKNEVLTPAAKQGLKQEVNTCIKTQMDKLGHDGNIFAQEALLRFHTSAKNASEMSYWYGMIQHQKGTAQYQAYERCTQRATTVSPAPLSKETPVAPPK